jgi:hypothetical protein
MSGRKLKGVYRQSVIGGKLNTCPGNIKTEGREHFCNLTIDRLQKRGRECKY